MIQTSFLEYLKKKKNEEKSIFILTDYAKIRGKKIKEKRNENCSVKSNVKLQNVGKLVIYFNFSLFIWF